jgi:glycosyltransferase involved in cell wall biosynthesis
MKIAYLAYWDVSQESGVLKKIARQMRAWVDAGCEVKLFIASPDDDIWSGLGDLSVEVVLSRRIRTHFLKTALLVGKIILWDPDLVYFRFRTCYPFLGILVRAVPMILEINTDDLSEYRAMQRWYMYLYHRLTRERIIKRARSLVCVTQEIASKFAQYQKPTVVIGNGIDLSSYSQLPVPKNIEPRIVFMGSPGYSWHGVDKILWLARRFSQWQFDLIGLEQKDLEGQVTSNVSTYGLLGHTQYKEILAKADVAVGTLALHRNDMDEACPLKVREYLAYGIPTIIGYHDTDFPKPEPFLLQLPNTPNNVMEYASKIEQFVQTSRGQRVSREKITHLDVGFKERERLAFLRKVGELPGDG